MKIACVLRSGGPYDGRYVRNLRAGVRHGLAGRPATFVCLTDVPDEVAADCDEVVVLEKNYPGWWSKLELFRLPGPCIYFDLDTLVIGDIGSLYEAVAAADVGFWMLKPFLHTETWASGVMAWAGDWSSITQPSTAVSASSTARPASTSSMARARSARTSPGCEPASRCCASMRPR